MGSGMYTNETETNAATGGEQQGATNEAGTVVPAPEAQICDPMNPALATNEAAGPGNTDGETASA